ncbi:SGNH/GDSL hydrolase family protein [Cellvibrio sp. pealriver]|uniref:SGNH/GDSL hydrolase family protein n=1 Tax=Cellvibrio sp. pealriver TaxID=1622269 RepID=UPI00066FD80E|nr:SGNH/GDSL hydrolase family protein [Cellvibrio sp. pealriver]
MQVLLKRTTFIQWVTVTAVLFSGQFFSGEVFSAEVLSEERFSKEPLSNVATAQTDKYVLPVHYSGRVLVEKQDQLTTYTYSWPGVYFEAEFNGPALDVRLNDTNNILNIIIDDKEPIVLNRPGKTTYSLNNLGEGRHKVRLEKRTETHVGTGTFEGFYVSAKESVLAPASRQRSIEFIGDSFSAGYANLSTSRECDGEAIFSTTNTHQTFGALTAKHFNADYQINAISGSGVVRNYNGAFPDKNFVQFYPYTILGDTTNKYESAWSPDIIVLELGGNDFATPLNPGEKWKNREALQRDYIENYTAFILDLRKKNPRAGLILVVPSMGSDELLQQHTKVKEQLKTRGETRVQLLTTGPMELTSCHWHPSVKDHQAVSQMLVDFINATPEIWKGK